jgi:Polypeptide deformylase
VSFSASRGVADMHHKRTRKPACDTRDATHADCALCICSAPARVGTAPRFARLAQHQGVNNEYTVIARICGACSDDGVGLAAPQVGVNVRLMVFNGEGERGKGEELVLANPRIVSTGKRSEIAEEGCLSFTLGGEMVLGDIEVCF